MKTIILAVIFLAFGNITDIEKNILKSLKDVEEARKESDVRRLALSYARLGYCYQGTENYDLSFEKYLYAINHYSALGDTISIINCYINISHNFNKLELPDKAIQYAEKARLLLKFKKNQPLLNHCLRNLSRASRLKNDGRTDLYYLQQIRDSTSVYHVNLGVSYFNLKNYDSAFINFQKAYNISLRNKDYYNISFSLNNLGMIRRYQKKYIESIKLHKEALTYNKNNEIAYLCLSDSYLEVEDPLNATRYYNLALANVTEYHDAIESGEKLTRYFKLRNELEKALVYSEITNRLKDERRIMSLKNDESMSKSRVNISVTEANFVHSKNLNLLEDKLKMRDEKTLYQFILMIVVACAFLYLGYKYHVKMKIFQHIKTEADKIFNRNK